jgi:predicted AlkP superfamily pyrophosphatase or phosphodiesterase
VTITSFAIAPPGRGRARPTSRRSSSSRWTACRAACSTTWCAGELPNLTALLGGDDLAHAYFDDTLLSTMPSTTMAAWTSAFTGVGPAEHGVTGNEFFIRETKTFACPAPASFADSAPTLEVYTDDYLGKLIAAPTMYERIRAEDPDALIWVAMQQIGAAIHVLLPKRGVIIEALKGFVALAIEKHEPTSREVYAALDTGAIDSVVDHLEHGSTRDVLTVYVYGTDLYAHVAPEGPDAARRGYLRDVVDPALGKLAGRLRARGMLDRLWVVVTSDHGHTEVPHDKLHAFGANDGPTTALADAGFRVRTLARTVDDDDPFSAVLAYGGATAYVYLADRSKCPWPKDVCPWRLPPRYEEDVLPAAGHSTASWAASSI